MSNPGQELNLEEVRRVQHDLTNILTTISGYAELLLEEGAGTRVQGHAKEIRRAVHRASQLLAELRELCRSRESE